MKHSHSLPSLPCSFNLLQCCRFITFSLTAASHSWLGFTPNPSAADGATERQRLNGRAVWVQQDTTNWVHAGHAFYSIFQPGVSGLVLKVENENDFHFWSLANWGQNRALHNRAETRCSNGRELRAGGANQIQGLVFKRTKARQNFSELSFTLWIFA